MQSLARYSGTMLILLGMPWTAAGDDWPMFRGAGGNGVAPTADLPTTWDVTSGEHVAWQAELPGQGPSSPIVVDGRVVVTCSGGRNQSQLFVLAFDAASGKPLWKRSFLATGRTLTHATSANAAPSPASDGQSIVAFYSSNDVICLDLDGNLQWYRGLAMDHPKLGNDIGMAASPIIIDNTVILQAESQGAAFAVGIDLTSGKNRWTVPRPREGNWTSPIPFRENDNSPPLVLLMSGEVLTAHDPFTGDEHWRYEATSARIASPVAEGEKILLPANGMTMLQVREDEPERLWDSSKLNSGACSPVMHQERVYSVARNGMLACADAESGKVDWKLRLEIGSQWATPVVCGNRMVCFGTDGKVAVIDLSGDKGQVVAVNDMGETIKSTPAVVDDAIYIRSDAHLWKLQAG